MSVVSFTYNNQDYTNWSAEDAVAAGIPEDVVSDALEQQKTQSDKIILRNKITKQAGDAESLIGTATDMGHFAIYALAHIIQGIDQSETLGDLKAYITDFKEIADNFLTEIDAETVILPFMAKGTETVIQEIKERATKTAQILGE